MPYTTEDEEFFRDEGIGPLNERVDHLRNPSTDEEIKALLEAWKAPAAPRSLDQRVMEAYRIQIASPLWKRALTASIRVPLPLAVAVMVLLLVSGVSLVASRASSPQESTNPAPSRIKVVEVPVVHEKIVTRTIPENRPHTKARLTRKTAGRHLEAIRSTVKPTAQDEGDSGRYFTHADLSGFRPIDQMKIEVIRRTKINED